MAKLQIVREIYGHGVILGDGHPYNQTNKLNRCFMLPKCDLPDLPPGMRLEGWTFGQTSYAWLQAEPAHYSGGMR
jgi:hypothetical protein